MSLRVASVAWKIRPIRGDGKYFAHFYDLVSAAHDEGAEAVVFPELHVLELLPLARDLYAQDAAKYLVQFSEAVEQWVQRISNSSGMTIVGGSHFKEYPDGIKNVSAIAVPGQGFFLAEKNNLTEYEKKVWQLAPGRGLTALPNNLGVTVCYDAEFPASGRALAESGTLVQCVPSWTETQRGFQRVRWSCLARAVENQNFVVHSALVGDLGVEPVPSTFGSSAIIAPSVEPFPVQAILRETELNEEGVVLADLDFGLLEEARSNGEVSNWNDRSSGHWETTRSPE
ncbi:MAG TPA: nitrilase-related carbon-nitrogen hydrolase [Fimbriimonas sp.]|nr:nitrilase-related carbon-nitrogen hydrolase [Fimbriimonas sp.]